MWTWRHLLLKRSGTTQGLQCVAARSEGGARKASEWNCRHHGWFGLFDLVGELQAGHVCQQHITWAKEDTTKGNCLFWRQVRADHSDDSRDSTSLEVSDLPPQEACKHFCSLIQTSCFQAMTVDC
eukprot:4154396-Amphidinium_carterae.1